MNMGPDCPASQHLYEGGSSQALPDWSLESIKLLMHFRINLAILKKFSPLYTPLSWNLLWEMHKIMLGCFGGHSTNVI